MEEPDVRSIVDVKSFHGFQVSKEVLPLFPKPLCNVIPDPLNPAIMDTPIPERLEEQIKMLSKLTNLPQMYEPLPPPWFSSIHSATLTFSTP